MEQEEGSPPLTRGTLTYTKGYGIRLRITPAYAGNTVSIRSSLINIQDHPRLRGEHSGEIFTITYRKGSPPLTRGTPLLCQLHKIRHRITPAYAGNTDFS